MADDEKILNYIKVDDVDYSFDASYLEGKEVEKKSNLTKVINDKSTSYQYPSAKALYDIVGNIEELYPNIIFYTTEDESTITPKDGTITGSVLNIVSNTYKNGKGRLVYDGDVHGIGDGAFQGCTLLKTINIPKTVITVGEDIFSDANAYLEKVIIYPETESMINKNLIGGTFEIVNKGSGTHVNDIISVYTWSDTDTWGNTKICRTTIK